jgi:hypothetical protein
MFKDIVKILFPNIDSETAFEDAMRIRKRV